jgi:hypothetical protein
VGTHLCVYRVASKQAQPQLEITLLRLRSLTGSATFVFAYVRALFSSYHPCVYLARRLCGLVVTVLATDPEVPGSIPGRYQIF